MEPHSSTLAWKIPWTEEPGGLQSMGSLRVGHDWATSLSLFTFTHWRRKWQPTPVFLPGESQGRGAWWAAVYGVAHSRTRPKWLSNSSREYVNNNLDKLLFAWDQCSLMHVGRVHQTSGLPLDLLLTSYSEGVTTNMFINFIMTMETSTIFFMNAE